MYVKFISNFGLVIITNAYSYAEVGYKMESFNNYYYKINNTKIKITIYNIKYIYYASFGTFILYMCTCGGV